MPNGQSIGKVIKNNDPFEGGNDDSCIIAAVGTSFTSTYPVAVQMSSPLQGALVSVAGYISGVKSTTVINPSLTYYSDDYQIWVVDRIQTSLPMQHGDSGGPLYNTQYYGSQLYTLVYGIQKLYSTLRRNFDVFSLARR